MREVWFCSLNYSKKNSILEKKKLQEKIFIKVVVHIDKYRLEYIVIKQMD